MPDADDELADLSKLFPGLHKDNAYRVARLVTVGEVAESAGWMESVLRGVVASLLGSARASIIVEGQQVSWLTQNAIAILDHNDEIGGADLGDPAQVEEFKKAIKRCEDLNRRRSEALHGAWVFGGDLQLLSKWRKPGPTANETSVEDLQKLRQDLDQAVVEVINVTKTIPGMVHGLPQPES